MRFLCSGLLGAGVPRPSARDSEWDLCQGVCNAGFGVEQWVESLILLFA